MKRFPDDIQANRRYQNDSGIPVEELTAALLAHEFVNRNVSSLSIPQNWLFDARGRAGRQPPCKRLTA